MEKFTVEPGKLEDFSAIISLYRAVAAVEGGLARTLDEITDKYIENFMRNSLESGVIIVARDLQSNQIIGEIHGYKLGPKVFAHIIGELTIAVHPEYQGGGIGRSIFTAFMKTIEENLPQIRRVELIARESNDKAIKFYEKMGFEIEGRLANRIYSVNGGFEADIPMGWIRK